MTTAKPMMRNLFSTAICAALLFALGCSQEPEKKPEPPVRPVKMLTIERYNGGVERKFPGTVRASRRTDMSFQVSGPLLELKIKEGMEVKKGDLLARIDPRNFESDLAGIKGKLAEAKAQLAAMKTGARPEDIVILKSQLASAKSSYEESKTNLGRMKRLLERGAVAKARVDQAQASHDAYLAKLRTAEENLAKGQKGARMEDIQAQEANLKALEASRDRAQDALDDTNMVAPFSGVVAKRFVEQHEYVQAKQSILSLQDISKVEVLVDLPENLISRMGEVRKGEVVATGTVPANPGMVFPLRLKEFATEADSKTQTYRVTLVMNRPYGVNILPGMTMEVLATPPDKTDKGSHVVIPAIAVMGANDNTPYVWVIDKKAMKVSKRQVETGKLTGKDRIFIKSGLKFGETIAVAGMSKLREGMTVSEYKMP